MEQSPLNIGARPELIAEQVNCLVVDRPRYVTIACGLSYSCRNHARSRLPDPNRGLMRKLADSLLHLIGYRRLGESFIDRQRD